MHILTRWSLRMARDNRMRTCTVILVLVGFFALWTSADYIVIAAVSMENIAESSLGISVASPASYIQAAGFFQGLSAWFGVVAGEMFSGKLITNSFIRAMINYLYYGLLMVMIIVLYSVFSVTADECMLDYRTLTSVGATARQLRRHLLQRAVLLTLVSSVAGVAVGLLTARLFLAGHENVHDTVSAFFRDARTRLMLVSGLLFAPCTMVVATKFAFLRRQMDKPPRVLWRRNIRRRFVMRVFGVGGLLGDIGSRRSAWYRVMFAASFAACLAFLAQLSNLMVVLYRVEPVLPADTVDLRIECKSDLPADDMDELLRQNADRFGIENCGIFCEPLSESSAPSVWTERCYLFLDRAWTAPYYNTRKSPVERDGAQTGLWRSFFGFAFLDDASFDRLAEENGIQAGTDGAILYNIRYFDDQKRVAPLTTLPDRDVTLYFLPASADTQLYKDMADDDFLRAAEPAAKAKTIRILTLRETSPYDLKFDDPTLLFPQRMYASFAELLSDDSAASAVKKTYYLNLSDPRSGIAAIQEAIRMNPRFTSTNIVFGMEEQNEKEGAMPTNVYDLHFQQDELLLFKEMIPKLLVILLATAVWILFVGVLNTAHMNRMTRRRSKAILESLGMGQKEKTGMLLYESARYALNGVILGRIFFTGLYFPLWGDFQDLLCSNALRPPSDSITFQTLILFGTAADWRKYLGEFGTAWLRTMPIFFFGAVLIFTLLILTDRAISRRGGQDDLIQILKDDTGSDGRYHAL